jgi:hypothetical protein
MTQKWHPPYYFTEMFGYQQASAVTTKRLRLTESVMYADR